MAIYAVSSGYGYNVALGKERYEGIPAALEAAKKAHAKLKGRKKWKGTPVALVCNVGGGGEMIVAAVSGEEGIVERYV